MSSSPSPQETSTSPGTVSLFGTSADPPTIGHYAILAGLCQRYHTVVTWASNNPFKQHGAPLAVRQDLLQMIVDDLVQQLPPAHTLQVRQDCSSSRAIDSINAAGAAFPTARLLLVVGVDLLPQIPRWFAADELLRRCCIGAVPRPGWGPPKAAIAALQAAGADVECLPLQVPVVASSQVRRYPQAELVPGILLPQLVAKGLYGFSAVDRPQQPPACHQLPVEP